MNDTTPNPWDFADEYASPDNVHVLTYHNPTEVAMGGPLRGHCYLMTKDGEKIKIHNRCGGPPVWETSGQSAAVPIWTIDRGQRIGVVNVITRELTIFREPFSVLYLASFDKNIIRQDRHITKFDIQKKRVETVIKLGDEIPPLH
jgi:hypothetical protein